MGEYSGVRLLIADVDGTLVTHEKVLTERACRAVAMLRAQGIRFAVTSGRPPRGMAMLVAPLQLEEPIAGFNGGTYTRSDLSIIEAHPLAQDVAREAVWRMRTQGLDVWVYSGNDWHVRDAAAPHVAREAKTVAFAPEVTPDIEKLLERTEKIVGVSDRRPLIRAADNELEAALGNRASVSQSQPYYLDVTHPLANKGAVVDFHARRLGLPAASICTIGDGPNDVLMFEKSGHSIAMGNASTDVKKRANAVTDSCDDDGFAKAVERYLL